MTETAAFGVPSSWPEEVTALLSGEGRGGSSFPTLRHRAMVDIFRWPRARFLCWCSSDEEKTLTRDLREFQGFFVAIV